VVSYVYELPFGKGKALASHGLLSYILGGFQTSGSLTLASGRPFTVFANSNSSSIDIGLQNALANVIGAPVMPRKVTAGTTLPRIRDARESVARTHSPLRRPVYWEMRGAMFSAVPVRRSSIFVEPQFLHYRAYSPAAPVGGVQPVETAQFGLPSGTTAAARRG